MKKINGIALKLLLAIMLICWSNTFAGTTGKISGRVIDAETKEPLYGVNVVLVGTNYGAATDMDGEFYMINLPPGQYTIKATMIGYNPQIIEKVRVQVDLTTKIDFELSSTAISLGQEITITAQKVIQKDLTSSERSMQSDQIQELPARDVTSILSMQAGIVKDANGALHIRGGRSSEITYLVDGVQVVNPLNRSSGISIDDQSIEELKAITGTFNAEYGQALSGVVNIVTKKGSDKFTANATAYIGDNLSFDEDLYSVMDNGDWARAAVGALTTKSGNLDFDFAKYGINNGRDLYQALQSGDKPWQTKTPYLNKYNPFRNSDLQLNLSGPVPGIEKYVSYYVAGRYQYRPGYQRGKRYFMPWGLWNPVMDSVHSFDMPDDKLVPLSWYQGKSAQAKVFFNFNSLNLSYGIYYNDDLSYGGGQKYLPDGGRYYFTDRYTQIFSATYVFSNSTFIDFKGSAYSNKHKSYLYEDPYDYRYMPTKSGDFQQFMFKPDRDSDIEVKSNPNDYSYWGNDVGRNTNSSKYYSFNVDLTSQIDKYNLVKLGATGRFHDIEQDYYSLQFDEVNYRPIIPDKSSAFHTYYSAKPNEYAAYIQNKIEFEELIINIGLRYDYFDTDGRVLADPRDPQIYSPFKLDNIYKNYSSDIPEDQLVKYTVEEREKFWYKKADINSHFSPRFGLSFPITAEGVIHFSYGHFYQNPEFQYLYTNPNFWVAGAGSQNLVGNSNLKPETTVMYEIGLQQQLFNSLFLHVTAFYRDIRDWVGTGYPVDTYRGLTYYSYVNRDNAVAKGITLSTSYRFDAFNINLDYTYMNANGTSSNPQDAYNDLSAGKAPRIQLVNLNWDQPHSLNAVLSYAKDGWQGTLIANYASGFPYTPEFARGEATGGNAATGLKENSERKPSTFNLDLRVAKTFKVGSFGFQAILDITNLLDTRNANYVYADTGLPDYTLQDYLSWSRLVEVGSSKEYYANPGMYSSPRYIQLGLRVSYE